MPVKAGVLCRPVRGLYFPTDGERETDKRERETDKGERDRDET